MSKINEIKEIGEIKSECIVFVDEITKKKMYLAFMIKMESFLD